jgi:hypothetical protein
MITTFLQLHSEATWLDPAPAHLALCTPWTTPLLF